MEARLLQISGTVQGVGFRPFVYRLAHEHDLAGWVLNASDGVQIHVQGSACALDAFLRELPLKAPPAAQISAVAERAAELLQLDGFCIRESVGRGEDGRTGDDGETGVARQSHISPDIATCPACLAELHDPHDRRFHYPFINCTNCGPRFTIIAGLPYDRHQTTMADFTMCPSCAAEYANAADRRFHAQPDACFACGPALSLRPAGAQDEQGAAYVAMEDDAAVGLVACDDRGVDARYAGVRVTATARGATVPPAAATRPAAAAAVDTATAREASDRIIAQVAELLTAGRIVAIKGIGGYHLACDAGNEAAVARLRERKQRPHRPFAVMV
ncbi:MAG: acylphosphatase, partial [Coriobacteriales bacterium]|nr:acylphosphatase [Coriobacteriales bacterium]